MKKLLTLCLLATFAIAAKEKNTLEDPLYYGDVSHDFVIRWGFQKFCDFVHDPRTGQYVWPTNSRGGVSFDPAKVKMGDVIFVRDVPSFFKKMNPYIKHPYIMVTHGEHLDKMKKESLKYLEEEKLIAWFGIHPSKAINHPKYFPIPIGVVQQPDHYKRRAHWHDLFTKIRATSTHKYTLYMNFADANKPERRKVKAMFSHKSYTKRGQRQTFTNYLKEMAQCKFTLSPKGLGIDCYRTWESLLVGSIPVVRKSQLDSVYEGLPVLIVDKWEDINEEFLEQKYKEIKSKKYDLSRLYMEYWTSKITAVRDHFLAHNK